ncbi:uncharacterized protein LOC126653969 [Mercurialis annua]|uniref:uncharacterized protein LOC126653969 n=1 Tax=Mercurialis annua TaxID=3986 RepID=UPI002160B1B3|nr:uncharacterized protein LOC126653969 [Mercurialis annua]
MEFKFRAVDGRPPACFAQPSSSTVSYFSQHSLQEDYPLMHPDPDLMGIEEMNREIEKERIREEILHEEKMRRRCILEAEVRRELMIERGLGALSFDNRIVMRFEPTRPSPFHVINQFDRRSWLNDGRPAFPSTELSQQPLQRLPQGPRIVSDVTPDNNKSKLIVLGKPDPNLFGLKRKAVTPPGGDAVEIPYSCSKKPREEWSCALCQVSASCEQGLKDHLLGKKHKAKEVKLRANNAAKTPPLPNKSMEKANLAIAEPQINEKSVQGVTNRKLKKKNAVKKSIKGKRKGELKTNKNWKFWCGICMIGTYSEVVMGDHKKGKKHLTQLQKLNQNAEPVSTITVVGASSSAAVEEAKNEEAVGKEADEKMMESVSNNEKITEIVAYNDKTGICIVDLDETVGDSMVS